jgi:hypothetical protein
VLGPDDELVGIAWVLIVMDQVREEGGEHVLEFEEVSHVTRIEQVVHALKGVHDVHLVVEWVVLEVAICDFRSELDEPLYIKVEVMIEVVHVPNLVHHELDPMPRGDCAEVESVEGGFFNLF